MYNQAPVKLNLGCGPIILPDWINVDQYPQSFSVRKVDLNRLPWPFSPASADEVLMSGCIEHLKIDPIETMRQIHRILKPGGSVTISTSHIAGIYNCMPDHRHYFSVGWFHDLCSNNFCRAQDEQLFLFDSLELKIFHGRPSFLDSVASWHPYLWEKLGILHPDTIIWKGTKP